jgi:hypothetical protein
MCGITGIFDTRGKRDIDRAVLQRMNDSQLHRGPDEGSLHLEPGVGLGHRRLSIIDIATGQQPLFNEDGSVVVVFNGEIYNYQQLIPELQALGHVFHTKSDTEVIVHAWEVLGRGLRQAFARHVCLCAVGPQPPDLLHGARPPGRQADALRGAGRRHAAVRLRAQVGAGPWRPAARHRPAGGGGVLCAGLRGRAAHHLPPGPQAAAGAHPGHAPRPAACREPRPTGMCASR